MADLLNIENSDVVIVKPLRSSNLELYRIICMLMIVAHHYVVNSGLYAEGGPLLIDFTSGKSIFLTLFGAWGKTGINCFLMITGYYMCTSRITLRKFVKLMAQIYFYRLLLGTIFLYFGYESFSMMYMVKLLMPFWGFSSNFTGCFIAFWLTIPFLTILVQNLNQRQHQLLLVLSLGLYTLLGSVPTFNISFNYITWFGIIFFISSYIRMYPHSVFERRSFWGWMTIISVLLAIGSILGLRLLFGERTGAGYNFVSDSNKIFAVFVAVSSFLWFKNMNIKYSKTINTIGGSTFGVFLIHTRGEGMRTWLWKDTVDVVGHYSLSFGQLVLFSIGVVLAVFVVCSLIDQLRIATLEKWFFNWYDRKLSVKVDEFKKRIITNKNVK